MMDFCMTPEEWEEYTRHRDEEYSNYADSQLPKLRPEGQDVFEWLIECEKNLTPEEKAEDESMMRILWEA